MILLVNNNADAALLPYSERYRLFASWPTALTAARDLGWQNSFGLGVDATPGMANVFASGDVNLMLMAIEAKP